MSDCFSEMLRKLIHPEDGTDTIDRAGLLSRKRLGRGKAMLRSTVVQVDNETGNYELVRRTGMEVRERRAWLRSDRPGASNWRGAGRWASWAQYSKHFGLEPEKFE